MVVGRISTSGSGAGDVELGAQRPPSARTPAGTSPRSGGMTTSWLDAEVERRAGQALQPLTVDQQGLAPESLDRVRQLAVRATTR